MKQIDRNIYQSARLAAGFTQERAAECLGVSVRSLAAYESGERIPPDDIAVSMADIYRTQWLVYQHVRANVEAAKNILPAIDLQSLPLAILKLHKEVSDFIALRDDMIEITCDGIIDATEQPRWNAILNELDDISAAILGLKFAREEDEHEQATDKVRGL